ncbi:hypothetical protein NML71_08005 [Streptococcus sp. CF4-2]|uniref:hypothetical protein n=1 Tax=Streptococcus TaxID=1301 RepID=UPI0008A603D6|nr:MULTISPECIES: hypothetical protein [unclassified Streptococcus]MCP9076424.1 hypothetical protein [Streptococcus sp. CF4-3]MCP9089109.1 hypothetical protein [Streptococcus sp. CF4-2]OFQ07262.1 hypothetical protein HMPREF2957_00505 [Streptococcus sp. HMSC062D07]
MRFKKIISVALALVVLLLSLLVFQLFQKTQLVMFETISFNMPLESFEKVFGKPHEIVEETEIGYHNPWRAKDPYLYKTGRLFYDYENFKWKGYSGRVIFTFSKSHRLQGAAVYFPVASKAQQKEVLYKITQDMKAEIEALPDYQSMTTDTVGLYDDGYRYKVKLKGQKRELWIDVYPTEYEDDDNPENNQYHIRIDQSRC